MKPPETNLKRVAGGLTTVATVGTCGTVTHGLVLVDEPKGAKDLKREEYVMVVLVKQTEATELGGFCFRPSCVKKKARILL